MTLDRSFENYSLVFVPADAALTASVINIKTVSLWHRSWCFSFVFLRIYASLGNLHCTTCDVTWCDECWHQSHAGRSYCDWPNWCWLFLLWIFGYFVAAVFEFIYPRIHESLQIPCQRLMKLLEWMWGNEYTKKWKNLRDRYARPQRVTQSPGYLKHLMHHTQAQMPSMMSATYVGCILVATKTQNRRLNKAFKCPRSEEATFTRRRLWRVTFRSLLTQLP